ncbi:hypothetical protein OG216_25005 [Streptomycetaceae bacterium NBC_01309]
MPIGTARQISPLVAAYLLADPAWAEDLLSRLTAVGDALDWALIRAEHERIPFTGRGFAILTSHADCPADLAAQAYREAPNAVFAYAARVPFDRLVAVGDEALWSRLAAACGVDVAPDPAASAEPAVTGGRPRPPDPARVTLMNVLEIAENSTPAVWAASRILRSAARNPDLVRDPAARTLIRRIRGQLDSADAWVVAIRLLPKFPGTLLELVHVAASTAAP